jgi:hypothetical protein
MKILHFALAITALALGLALVKSRPLDGDPLNEEDAGMDSILLKLVQDSSSLLTENSSLNAATEQASIPEGMLSGGDGLVIVEFTAVEPNTPNLVRVLEELGATVTGCFSLVEGRCSATVKIADLPTIAASPSIKWIGANIAASRETPPPGSRVLAAGANLGPGRDLVGSVESQASQAMFADVARQQFNVDGTGVKVCVMAESFNLATLADDEVTPIQTRAEDDVALGDLPPFPRMDIVRDYDGPPRILNDFGRGMMQLIHDVAPGANLGFHTASLGQSGFAEGIVLLVARGCNVIVENFNEFLAAWFQDDLIAQAADFARDQGVVFFSGAGTRARASLEVDYSESAAGVNGLLHQGRCFTKLRICHQKKWQTQL